jgi:CBS-domain-containing membrane protein
MFQKRRYDVKTELLLALFPTVIVISILYFVKTFTREPVLFSSLAASSFLIYLDPTHHANSIRSLIISQLTAAIAGYGAYVLFGAGYSAAICAMVITVAIMVFAHAMHPPAVASSLLFAFRYTQFNIVLLFLLTMSILVVLILLQRFSVLVINRIERKREQQIHGRF